MSCVIVVLNARRKNSRWGAAIVASAALALCCSTANAQTQIPNGSQIRSMLATALPEAPIPRLDADAPQPAVNDTVTIRDTPMNILRDQAVFWTSPARIRTHDLKWLAPLAAATGVALATDSYTLRHVVSHDPQFNHNNVDASNAMLTVLIAVPVVSFGYGQITGSEHPRETGILGGESLVNAFVLEQGTKLIFWRERPGVDNANGHFFQTNVGVDSSFPSSHSVFAWSTAAVIAGEYPSAWSQATVYTLATGVSLTRVLGQEHFPTDVLVGGAIGWLAGHYVYKVRHRWQRRNQ